MNKVAFRWNRPLQLLGLVLIAVLSVGTEAARGQELDGRCFQFLGCEVCVFENCTTWVCPVGHPDGVGIACFR